MPDKAKSLAGQTLRWKFEGGPTAGAVYEHTFGTDGTVTFREVGGKAGAAAPKDGKGEKVAKAQKKPSPPEYASFEVAPSTHLVSYLSESGFTLTVALNLETRRCWGIGSSEKEWFPLEGELVPAQEDRDAA